MPTVGAFYHPTSRSVGSSTSQGWLATPTNMWSHTALSNSSNDVLVIVTLIETQVARAPRATWCPKYDMVECRTHHPLVVEICARNQRSQWHPTSIGQNMSFDASFGSVGWIRASEVPPLGALTIAVSSEAHANSTPQSSS